MFPIRDSVPTTQTPVVVYGIIAVNTLVFLYQITLSPTMAVDFAYSYGLVPYFYFDGTSGLRHGLAFTDYLPFLTATFMHGGWLHIIFNMWTLLIFGSTLESRMGSPQFLIFYLCCGVVSIFAHGYFNVESQVPVIGASGAIAGVIGAYAVRFPTARVTLLVPIVIIPLIFTVPGVVYAVLWFGIQLLQGAWEKLSPGMGSGIAWWAHVGGFVAGLVLLPVFLLFAPTRPPKRESRPGPWDQPDQP
jgi:membrane associated rhomboid family serine protease